MRQETKKRQWYQLSLRSLLVVVLLFSVALAVVVKRWNYAKQQRNAVASITSRGMVFYSFHLDENGKARKAGPNTLAPPPWYNSLASKLLGDDFTADVVGAYVNVHEQNDLVWTHLRGLTRLRVLSISGNSITDRDLDALEGLGSLVELEVSSKNVTENRLALLRKSLPRCCINRPPAPSPISPYNVQGGYQGYPAIPVSSP